MLLNSDLFKFSVQPGHKPNSWEQHFGTLSLAPFSTDEGVKLVSKELYSFRKGNVLLFKKCPNTLSIQVSGGYTAGRFRIRSLVFPSKTQQEPVLLAVLSHSEILGSYQWKSGSLLRLVLHNQERRKRNAICKVSQKKFLSILISVLPLFL